MDHFVMGATQQLRAEHAQLLAQFHRIDPAAGDAACHEAAHSLCTALERHAQLKEEFLYPALRHAGVQSAALDRCGSDHEQMRRLIGRLRASEAPATRQDLLHELMNGVMHHMADEETQLLPAAERFLGPQRLAELGLQMHERRLELSGPQAAASRHATPAKAALVAFGALLAGSLLVHALRGRRHAHA
jgi:iron-sulfur cluster repair protein YtfE (RIC family)